MTPLPTAVAAVVAVVTMVRMMTMVAMVAVVPMMTSVVASMMRATILRTATTLVPRVAAHETTHAAQQSSAARAASTIAVWAVAASMVSVTTATAVAVPTVLEFALEDVGGHRARGAAEERAQLALAHLVAEVAASTAADQRRPEAALAVLALGAARVVAPSLLVFGVVPCPVGVRVGRVRSRRRVVGRQVATLLLVPGRRRAVRRGAYIRMCGAGACVLWMRRVGREVATGLCVLLLRGVRGRRLSVLWLRRVLVLGWVGAAASIIVIICS